MANVFYIMATVVTGCEVITHVLPKYCSMESATFKKVLVKFIMNDVTDDVIERQCLCSVTVEIAERFQIVLAWSTNETPLSLRA